MPNEVLTGARYPSSSAAPNVNQDIQNAVADLADNTIPNFATTGARDTAYASWVSAGNTMRSGLMCTVVDKPYIYSSGWRGLAKREAGGSGSFTLNGTGDINIAHGLGAVPTTWWANTIGTGGANQFGLVRNYQAATSTDLCIRVVDSRDGSAMAGFAIVLMWGAAVL